MIKQIMFTGVLVLCLTACSNNNSSEESNSSSSIVEETSSATSEISESKKESKETQETQALNEWLTNQNHPHEDLIMENLDQLSLDDMVKQVADDVGVSLDNVSLSYYNYDSDERYHINGDTEVIAASISKIPTAMIYYNMLDRNAVSLETEIPYANEYYQDGNGLITEKAKLGTVSSTYPLGTVLYESIVNSDNTANTMLRRYYDDLYGSNQIYQALANLTHNEWTKQETLDNTLNSEKMQHILMTLTEDDTYKELVDMMLISEKDLFTKKYITGDMATKYGALYDYLHHVGIYYIEDQPAYNIVIFTNELGHAKADEFMGQLNLQLATLAQYEDYKKDADT